MKKYLLYSIAIITFYFLGVQSASAGAEHNMAGYAWSSTIGWISFNCTNDNSCGTANYGVNKNPDNTLSGYAWSSAIGWIQFGGLSSFPSGSGTQSTNAQINGNNLQGWARALSADGQGWDGWISLSGAGPSYGVTLSGTYFAGYAWGSDVVGWILFDVHTAYPAICADCGVKLAGDASLDVQVGGVSIVNNGAVPHNSIPTFIWTLTNIPSASCSVSKTSGGGTAFSTINGITSSGSTVGSSLTGPTSYTYAINCTNPTISKSVGFTVAAQPPGFTMGGTETAQIQFLSSTAESEQKTFFVSAFGGFSETVSVDVTSSTCPGSTKYSLGGGAFSTNPSPVSIVSPYNAGSTFRAQFTARITNPCTVTLTGTSATANATKDYVINPTTFSPTFEEY